MGGIWWLSSRRFQAPAGPEDLLRVAANLVHAPLYGALFLLFGAWFAAPSPAASTATSNRPSRPPALRRAWSLAAFGATLLYALVDELHQASTGRHPSAFDLVTDAAGALSALAIALYLAREGATDRGLLRRAAVGALACLAAAVLASFVGGA
jgi:hypothetical protein